MKKMGKWLKFSFLQDLKHVNLLLVIMWSQIYSLFK